MKGCPKCNSTNIAKIQFGYPAYSDELQKNLDDGKVVLDGCVINEEFCPDKHCNIC